MDHIRIHAVLLRELAEPSADPARSYPLAVFVDPEIARVAANLREPCQRRALERRGDVDAAELPAFSVDVDIAGADVLDLELEELMYARPCCAEEPNDEIPSLVFLGLQPLLQVLVV